MESEHTVTVTLVDGSRLVCPAHTEVGTLARGAAPASGLPYIGALVNNEVTSLSYPIEVDADVKFLTMADPYGWPIYERSVSFLLAKTVRELFPACRFSLEYSFGPGLYCSLEDANGRSVVTETELRRIRERMVEQVRRHIPIERRKLPFTRAVERFETAGQYDKLNLLKFRNEPRIVMHGCEDFSDLVHGPLAPGTGVLGYFDLIPYPPGFVLQLPAKGKPTEVAPFRDQPHLFQIFQEHKEWGRILGVNTVGRLNEVIANGEISEFINISEALHEKKVATIADRIGDRRGVRIVLVSGPSSAGKTTFSKRLAIQLRVNGRRTLGISLDDYFVASDRTPRDEAGQPDFEHIEAVDIAAFNSDLNRLINGEEVELPRFNFETRQREFSGKKLRVADDHVIIIEGIHGLNPRLTHRIAADRKFKIYISALTQLSIDSNNRISTTDNRLLRRMIRDHKFRGHPALTTLRMWPSVRRGEERWVFPFQGEADATFNSALDYELAVLKPMVEPLLMQVKPCDPEYAEARRLTAFLLNFLDVPDHGVPRTSILREYIGRSGFHY